MSASNGSWCARQRQEWIADTLQVFRFLNLEHLQRKFGISRPQASLDLRRFQQERPGVIRYDVVKKCYVAIDHDDNG
jgi:hypothetical protein